VETPDSSSEGVCDGDEWQKSRQFDALRAAAFFLDKDYLRTLFAQGNVASKATTTIGKTKSSEKCVPESIHMSVHC
jgi:hypothetical protein